MEEVELLTVFYEHMDIVTNIDQEEFRDFNQLEISLKILPQDWLKEFNALSDNEYEHLGEWEAYDELIVQIFIPANYPDEPLDVTPSIQASILNKDAIDRICAAWEDEKFSAFFRGSASHILSYLEFLLGHISVENCMDALLMQVNIVDARRNMKGATVRPVDMNSIQENSPTSHEDGKHLPNTTSTTSNGILIHHGPISEVNHSKFQGHLALVSSVKQVEEVMLTLKSYPRISRATHNMLGYRIAGEHDSMVNEDFDSDGESCAGRKLKKLFNAANVATDVIVVVTRWYGGVHLGPQRFRIITNVARDILREHKMIA